MPNYKVVDADVLDADLQTVADAIKAKAGTEEALEFPSGFASAVESIETGGGGDHTNEDGLITGTLTEYTNDRVESVGAYGLAGSDVVSVSLPNVTLCKSNCFYGCDVLTSVKLPKLVTIGTCAFQNCKALPSILLPNLTETITGNDESQFKNCTALKNASLPKYTGVLYSTFYGCNALEIADIGNSQTIYTYAFRNCKNLKTLIIRKTSLCSMSAKPDNAFYGTPFAEGGTGGTVYVPAALIEQYQTATNWSTLYAAGTCNFVAIEGSEYE